jgi:hypothetical protein
MFLDILYHLSFICILTKHIYMRKLTSILLTAVLLAVVMPACKKGENDPAISLRSRKARVAGEWKVTSGSGSYTETGTNPYNSSWTYNGSTYTQSSSWGSTTAIRTIEYTFEKDGTFVIKDTEDGQLTTIEGNWNFASGVGETKRKSQLVLSYTKMASSWGTTTINGFYPFVTFEIDELRNDKMVIKTVNKGSGTYGTYEETDEWVLESK